MLCKTRPILQTTARIYWTARQRNVHLGITSAGSGSSTLRCYSSGKTGENDGLRVQTRGSVTTNTPAHTDVSQLIDALPRNGSNAEDIPDLLLLLLTPTYAHHALEWEFTGQILNALRAEGSTRNGLTSVTAVVDRIPTPNDNFKEGSEGLAYSLLGGYSSASDQSLRALPQSAQKPGWLDFRFTTSRNGVNIFAQLPLARTIFSTGNVSTLIHRTYSAGKDGRLRLENELNLESFQSPINDMSESANSTLHAPLVPLTPARSIGNIMGNIIRTVAVEPSFSGFGKSSVEMQPASEELEQAVTDYFNAANMSPQPVSVWALIIPSPIPSTGRQLSNDIYGLLGSQPEDIRALWTTSANDRVDDTLNSLLSRGARLCKVLSGGGGWGKKAGLLSLDPDSSYSTRELRQDEGWDFDLDENVEQQKKQALGEIAKKGESVMFFIAPESLSSENTVTNTTGVGASVTSGVDRISAAFGTLPSSIDDVPVAPTDIASGDAPTITYHPHFMGALSEGGLAFNITGTSGETIKTKFDIPYSRITTSHSQGTLPASSSSRPRVSTSGVASKRAFSTATTLLAKNSKAAREDKNK